MATTTSPGGGRSPTTPASSVSSVRDLISRLEKSGGNDKETKETNKTIRKDGTKITTGLVSASQIHVPSPTNRSRDIQRPVPIAKALAPKIEATAKPTDQTPNGPPEKPIERVANPILNKKEEHVQLKVTDSVLEKTAEGVRKQTGHTGKAVEKAPVKSLGEMFEKISLKRSPSPRAGHHPILSSPTIPFSPTRTLFPRNYSPVRRTGPMTASLPAVANTEDDTPSTPTTPSWRCRKFSEDHQDRESLVSTSPSLPAMPTARPITPATPKTPPTPTRGTTKYSETPEDYSLTLLRYKAYFERPLARYLDGEGVKVEAAVVDDEEKKVYESNPRRQGKDVDAFWAPVRQYLLITDEELYES